MRKRFVLWSVFLLATVATSLPAQGNRAAPSRVFAPDSFWTVLWSRGFRKEPDLFIEPRKIATENNAVLVLDHGTRDVLALDISTGKSLIRITSQRGSGPGEFRRPSELLAMPNGFVVSDHGNARVSAFDLNGRFVWDTPLPEPTSKPVCVSANGRSLLLQPSSGRTFERRDTSGTLLQTIKAPWSGDTSRLSASVATAGPTSRGECIAARMFGSEYVVISPNGAAKAFRYIESIEEPKTRSTTKVLDKTESKGVLEVTTTTNSRPAAMNAMLVGDTLIVHFAGGTKDGMLLLDYYLLPSGRYLHSRKLPGILPAVTLSRSGVFVGAEIREESAGVVAFRPSAAPPKRTPAKLTR